MSNSTQQSGQRFTSGYAPDAVGHIIEAGRSTEAFLGKLCGALQGRIPGILFPSKERRGEPLYDSGGGGLELLIVFADLGVLCQHRVQFLEHRLCVDFRGRAFDDDDKIGRIA